MVDVPFFKWINNQEFDLFLSHISEWQPQRFNTASYDWNLREFGQASMMSLALRKRWTGWRMEVLIKLIKKMDVWRTLNIFVLTWGLFMNKEEH